MVVQILNKLSTLKMSFKYEEKKTQFRRLYKENILDSLPR